MSQHTSEAIRKPRTDDRPLWDIVFGSWGHTALLVVVVKGFCHLPSASKRVERAIHLLHTLCHQDSTAL
jgi:hypothetical protein